MRYRRAVERLRMLADACQHTTNWPPDDEPFLREAHVFGEVLDGDDPVDHVKVAMVLDLPPEEVPWESHPRGTRELLGPRLAAGEPRQLPVPENVLWEAVEGYLDLLDAKGPPEKES